MFKLKQYESPIVFATLALGLVWVVSTLSGHDLPLWYDTITAVMYAGVTLWRYVEDQREKQRYVEKLEREYSQPCVHCGEHPREKITEVPLVFMRWQPPQEAGCDCVDGHVLNCPNAPI